MISRAMLACPIALLGYLMISYVLEVVVAMSGLPRAMGQYPGALLWFVRFGALLMAIFLARKTWQWAGSRSRSARIVFGAALFAGVLLLGICVVLWSLFRDLDSDYSIIGPDDVNSMLGDPGLPASARDIHLLVIKGQTAVMCLRFSSSPEDSQRFTSQVLAEYDMGPEAFMGVLPFKHMCLKWWWKPLDEVGWWYKDDGNRATFIQLDKQRGTVHMLVKVSG